MPSCWCADVNPGTVPEKVHLIRRDPTQPGALRPAHPERAQHVLITGPTDGDVLVTAVLLRKEAPEVPVSALVRSASVGEALRDLGIRQTVAADQLVAAHAGQEPGSPSCWGPHPPAGGLRAAQPA